MTLNKIVLGASLLLAAGVSQATTIKFENQTWFNSITTVEENGFSLTQLSANGFGLNLSVDSGGGLCMPLCAYNGSAYLSTRYEYPIILSKNGGGVFDLVSVDGAKRWIDLRLGFDYWNASGIDIAGYKPDGSIVYASYDLQTIDKTDGNVLIFNTFKLPSNFVNLSKVTFTGLHGYYLVSNNYALDNISLVFDGETAGGISPVPEPSNGLMWLSGIAMLGLAFKKRLFT